MIDWDKPLATTDGRKVTKVVTLQNFGSELYHVLQIHNQHSGDCHIIRSQSNKHIHLDDLVWGRNVVIINDVVGGKFYCPILNNGKYPSTVMYFSLDELREALTDAGIDHGAVIEFTTENDVVTDVMLIPEEKK